MNEISRRKLLHSMGWGLVAGAALPPFGNWSAYRLTVESHTLRLPRWDAAGLKIGFISDFHLNGEAQTARAIEAVGVVINLKPDVLVLGGDYIEHDRPAIRESLAKFLSAFDGASCPCLAIMGNHDYWSRAGGFVADAFGRSSVRLLRNQLVEFQGVSFAGLDDYIDKRAEFDFYPPGNVSKSLVTLLHEPDLVRKQPEHVSLQLSGHSHGGQVCLPFGKHLHTPKWARDYVSGFYEKAPVPLYVSRGVGTTGPDLRLFCGPEVTMLTLA